MSPKQRPQPLRLLNGHSLQGLGIPKALLFNLEGGIEERFLESSKGSIRRVWKETAKPSKVFQEFPRYDIFTSLLVFKYSR